MRSVKLFPALAVTAAFALAPAGALAAKHHALRHHRLSTGSCRLSIAVAPRFEQAGGIAEVFGQLHCPKTTPVAGLPVTVLQSSGTSGTSTLNGMTDGSGNYKIATGALQTNSVFTASAAGAQSASRRVVIAPKVELTTPSTPADGTELFTGAGPVLGLHHQRASRALNQVVFTGTTSAAQGAEVLLERQNAIRGESWNAIGHGKVQAGGTFSIPHIFGVPGPAEIRVIVKPFGSNGRGVSDIRSYEVSQAQNPALTIHSTVNPLSYEGATTISGVLLSNGTPAAAGTPVVLLSRTRSAHAFTPVTQGTVGTGGSYAFAGLKPLQNTLYRVTGAGQSSAALFEGVKFALTTEAPLTSAMIGQPVTFKGTVTPWHAGDFVYLQQQDRPSSGFRVIQRVLLEAPTTPGGPATFTFTHAFYNAGGGSKKVRIKIPGDAEEESVSSALFEIALTPTAAPAAETPGNSSLPVGQI